MLRLLLFLRISKSVHESVFRINRADIAGNNLIFKNQKICADIFLLVGVVENGIGISLYLFAAVFAQVKTLSGLNLIVILIDFTESLGNDDINRFNRFGGHFPAKAL